MTNATMSIEWKISSRPDEPREYEAEDNGIRFHIYQASDAGFGISAWRGKEPLHRSRGSGIVWLRTLKRCKEHAERILEQSKSEATELVD